LTSAIDEIASHAHQQSGLNAFASNLQVDLVRPVPVGANVKLSGQVVGVVRDKLFVDVRARLVIGNERVATALAIFERCEGAEQALSST
jgi:acyl-CoA hydrolase